MCTALGHVGSFCRILNRGLNWGNCGDAMSVSRRFLLMLLLATITCFVVIQMSLDGKTFRNILHSSESELQIASTVHTDKINFTSSRQQNHITSTTAFPKNSSTTSTTAFPKKRLTYRYVLLPPLLKEFHNSINKSSVKTTFLPEKISKKPTQNFHERLQIRKLQVGRSKVETRNIKKQPIIVDRHSKLQEILKHSEALQRRARGDPLKALKVMPTADPKKVIRIFVITYFRSGSSFLGELLQQNSKTFYQFEPLHYMTYDSRITEDKTSEAFELFKSIYHCNFTNLDNYFNWAKKPKNQFLFSRSLFLWFSCRTNPKMCFNPDFVSTVCLRAPIQITKVTRIHMRQLQNFLLENEDLDIKVVYLTRDPRGIVSSRWALDWCNGTNCSDPRVLCTEMEEDIQVFHELQRQKPFNFIHVRYEDLTQNPEKEVLELFKFLNLPFSSSVQRFLRSHTIARKADSLDPYSTRRNSSAMAFSWKQRITYEQIQTVQSFCSATIVQLNFSLVSSPYDLCWPNCSYFFSLHSAFCNSKVLKNLNFNSSYFFNSTHSLNLKHDNNSLLSKKLMMYCNKNYNQSTENYSEYSLRKHKINETVYQPAIRVFSDKTVYNNKSTFSLIPKIDKNANYLNNNINSNSNLTVTR